MQERLPAPEFESHSGSVFPPPAGRRVYCNRNMRLDQVKAVGFDMDYTLAIYRQAEMDRQSIEATVSKLVDRGYPEELLSMKYRTDFPIRGLLIDRKLGNVLKIGLVAVLAIITIPAGATVEQVFLYWVGGTTTAAGDDETRLRGLAGLRGPVDRFFDDVLVMTPDTAIRHNRLGLVHEFPIGDLGRC